MIYIYIFLFLVFLSFFEVILKNYDNKKRPIIFSFLFLFSLMIGIRQGVGIDYTTYSNIFTDITDFSSYTYLESGFRIFIIIIKKIGGNFHVFSYLFGIISMFFLYKAVSRSMFRNKFLALLILYSVFLINYSFNGIRQGLIMSIFLYSLSYFEDEKYDNWRKVVFLGIVAMLFHSSGLIIIFAYFIRNIRFKSFTKYLIILGSLGLYFFNPFDFILVNVLKVMGTYQELFNGGIDFFGVLQRAMLIFFITYNIPKLSKRHIVYEKVYTVYLIGFFLYFLFGSNAMLATRLNMGIRILEVFLVPAIIFFEKRKIVKVLLFGIIVIWCVCIFYSVLTSPTILPYNHILW